MYTMSSIRKNENLKLAYKRILTNPESTYKSYFRDVYTAFGMSADDNIRIIAHKLTAGYIPNKSIRAFMPKSNGLNRMYTLLSIEDQIVYQAFANIIAEAITDSKVLKRYKKCVFGNLYNGKNSMFFYQQWQDSYKAYTRAVISAYQNGNEYIASFDLTACYDSINHSLLKSILTKHHISNNCADEFIRLLGRWESADGIPIGTGIPQGPQASGIVAEAVLSEYDQYIEKLKKQYKFEYFRYVDDIRILSDNRENVEWILFLLDKKSKELGLFPQSSKITVHKIVDIDAEVKRISTPLFENDFSEDDRKDYARKNIAQLIKKDPPDLTSIKRYFHFVEHSDKTNKIAIRVAKKYPNMIHSVAYYVQRYPRKVPKYLTNYIYKCCQDKTQQFASGILLEAIIDNLNSIEYKRFGDLANILLKENNSREFIIDCRFKAMLLVFSMLYGNITDKKIHRLFDKEENWWVKKEVLSKTQKYSKDAKFNGLNIRCIKYTPSDVSIIVASNIISETASFRLPKIEDVDPMAQNLLKEAKLIQRNRYSNSQISRYISEIIGNTVSFPWRKKLKNEHSQLELKFFRAHCYWNTDLTAFVNLWDTIDDSICYALVSAHPELGGYQLGSIGAIKDSKKFRKNVPSFYKMLMEIHDMRLKSHLSHSVVKKTQKYTGPIAYKEKRKIQNLIKAGITELVSYW